MFEDLEAAGLFEGLPDEEYRRTIARHLLDAGFTTEDVTAIVRSPDPGREATFRLLFPEPRLTAAEFAARIDMPVEKIDRIRLAAGLPPTDSSSTAAGVQRARRGACSPRSARAAPCSAKTCSCSSCG